MSDCGSCRGDCRSCNCKKGERTIIVNPAYRPGYLVPIGMIPHHYRGDDVSILEIYKVRDGEILCNRATWYNDPPKWRRIKVTDSGLEYIDVDGSFYYLRDRVWY